MFIEIVQIAFADDKAGYAKEQIYPGSRREDVKNLGQKLCVERQHLIYVGYQRHQNGDAAQELNFPIFAAAHRLFSNYSSDGR